MTDDEPRRTSTARRAGQILQGLVLGLLLSVSVVELWAAADGTRLFRYQNF